ncbi:interleukin-1 receptor-associated kinase 1-like [Gouania willdenowi]|uniref:interleukin-1 receptor-associated kinase 1-like n=1 Tax=Gouania willdenowi TaxID=441366 RepID=UPI0010563A4D|nr:interleukin-1 receptor-associated kinase 1-like [Gouania willdenowi]
MSLRGGGWRSELLERVVSLGPVDCQGPSSVPIPDMESTSRFLYDLPPSVRWRFCRVMDGLSDLDWTRFASEVLSDQTDVQLAERRERRTDWVMVHLENRNRTVGYLSNVLERLHLFRPRDIILTSPPNQTPSFPQLPPTDPPPKRPEALPTFSCLSTAVHSEVGGAKALPGPGPPPSCLLSAVVQDEVINDITSSAPEPLISGVALQWPFEEVHSGTEGFSSTLQVGEGGFGVVYRASLRNVQCAVKRLRRPDQSEDCLLDWSRLRESFRTEVEKLSKFRHPNIVDLMGFSEGCGEMCLIYSFMDHRSLEHQLHNECVSLSWPQRIRIVEEASAALQFLHSSPEEVIHGDVKRPALDTQQVLEGSWEFSQPVHMCFVDLQKALDCVPLGFLWGVLLEYRVNPLIQAVCSLYDRSQSLVTMAVVAFNSHRIGSQCEVARMKISTSMSESMVLDRKKVECLER